jgi:hypothetical protein
LNIAEGVAQLQENSFWILDFVSQVVARKGVTAFEKWGGG